MEERKLATPVPVPLVEKRSADGTVIGFRPPVGRIIFGIFWTAFSSIFLVVGLTGLAGKSSSDQPWVFVVMGGLFVLIGLTMTLQRVDLRIDTLDGTYRYRKGFWPFLSVRRGHVGDIDRVEVVSSTVRDEGDVYSMARVLLRWRDSEVPLQLAEYKDDAEKAATHARELSGLIGVRYVEPLKVIDPGGSTVPAGLKLQRMEGMERLILPPAPEGDAPQNKFMLVLTIGSIGAMIGPVIMYLNGNTSAAIVMLGLDAFVLLWLWRSFQKRMAAAGLTQVIEKSRESIRIYSEGPDGPVNELIVPGTVIEKFRDGTPGAKGSTRDVLALVGAGFRVMNGLTPEQAEWVNAWMAPEKVAEPKS